MKAEEFIKKVSGFELQRTDRSIMYNISSKNLLNWLDDFAKHQNKECQWTKNNDAYETECGNIFEFTNGGPQDNGAKFCQYCGGIIK